MAVTSVRTMRIYQEYPEVYDKLYGSLKEYAWESERIKNVLPADATRLVNVGCGTGLHDEYFVDDYDVVGIDASESMLRVAREKNDEARYMQDDMSSFSLDEQFDVALCLFGVVSYLDTVSDLHVVIDNMASHLTENGMIVIDFVEPRRKEIEEGPLRIESYREEGVRVTRTGVAEVPSADQLVMEYHTVVAEGTEVARFKDRHCLKHFSEEEYRSAFDAAGLRAELVGDDWPFWMATSR